MRDIINTLEPEKLQPLWQFGFHSTYISSLVTPLSVVNLPHETSELLQPSPAEVDTWMFIFPKSKSNLKYLSTGNQERLKIRTRKHQFAVLQVANTATSFPPQAAKSNSRANITLSYRTCQAFLQPWRDVEAAALTHDTLFFLVNPALYL